MTSDNQKLSELERQVAQLMKQLAELNQRVSFLERENNRRKSDLNTLSNRKG
jgi:prefoldin subunit 5